MVSLRERFQPGLTLLAFRSQTNVRSMWEATMAIVVLGMCSSLITTTQNIFEHLRGMPGAPEVELGRLGGAVTGKAESDF